MIRMLFRIVLLFALSSPVFAAEGDPFEGLNRKVFKFNEWIDKYSLKPMAKLYRKITPKPISSGVTNFFGNINDVSVVVNDLFQWKIAQAGADGARLLINSTVGLLGLVDVASRINLPKHNEDFGQTLGKWGVPSGPYLMVPFLGPFTLSEAVGYPVESYLSYFRHVSEPRERNTTKVIQTINDRANLLSAEAFISGDRYSFVRDAFLQQREFLEKDGEVEDDFLDDFEDLEEDEF